MCIRDRLNSGGGNNTLNGGNGKDTYYVLESNEGNDTINNFATDGKMDTLIITAELHEINVSNYEESNDLYLIVESKDRQVLIKNWFLNESYRHMILVTKDHAVVELSSGRKTSFPYQSLLINMSQIEVQHDDPYTRKIDLSTDPNLFNVITVFGTPDNDSIVGNDKDNYLMGEQGYDYMQGNEGADTYVVKRGDGSKTILNCAKYNETDTLIFGAKFDDILLLNNPSSHLILTTMQYGPTSPIKVTLRNWFEGEDCQHMVVHSLDGVTFGLPTTAINDSPIKTARIIDNSKLNSSVKLNLTGKWDHVEAVFGSQGSDTIVGNSFNNYMDPGPGGCYLQGGNGSDVYIIRSTYGQGNIVNNIAEDNQSDTLFVLVPFSSIKAKKVDTDIQLLSDAGDDHLTVHLSNYCSDPKTHHLIVVTSDDILSVLPVTNNSDNLLVPIAINRARANTGQYINLTNNSNFSEVSTVYGSNGYQNSIVGNELNNTLVGGNWSDFIQGLNGDDTLKGLSGDDIIDGGQGMDIIVGGDGDDILLGGEDDDVIAPGVGVNQVYGGSGNDTVIYSGNVLKLEGIKLDLIMATCIHEGNAQDTLNSIENAYGTEYDDMLQGNDGNNVLVGQGGNDYLSPGAGYDILNGGNGSDTYHLPPNTGIVTILNYAKDGAPDKVIMMYCAGTNTSLLKSERVADDLIIRMEYYKATVIFKDWYKDSNYQHAELTTADRTCTVVNPSTLLTCTGQSMETNNRGSPLTGLYVILGVIVLGICVAILTLTVVYKTKNCPRNGYRKIIE